MNPEKRFYIKGSKSKRPQSQCAIYVDGTAGEEFREGIDIELSHWVPNRTENQYKAGTSTEICFKYLNANESSSYDLVINNHLDVDGILSTFVLCYPKIALAHRDVLVGASKAGDFWAWAEGHSLKLFQELTLFYRRFDTSLVDLQKAYELCFDFILNLLKSPEAVSPVQDILERQFSLIDRGEIERREISHRLTAYFVPQTLSKGKVKEFLQIPKFNEPLSEEFPFWPQVRNRLDEEKIHLVAVATESGIHYDLWYPGYVWADTQGLWVPPGLILPDSMEAPLQLQWPALSQVIQKLNEIETGVCSWQLFPEINLFRQRNPRKFPVVATTVGQNDEAKESGLSLETVTDIFREIAHLA
ncbi:MAG: hypothetical protein K2Y08_06585 [Alphaproteobacteria bacterium]|nr:hypothetical protein [Alphaproteobacteria bacterium]